MKRFSSWIMQFLADDTPIGDLARDIRSDIRVSSNGGTYNRLRPIPINESDRRSWAEYFGFEVAYENDALFDSLMEAFDLYEVADKEDREWKGKPPKRGRLVCLSFHKWISAFDGEDSRRGRIAEWIKDYPPKRDKYGFGWTRFRDYFEIDLSALGLGYGNKITPLGSDFLEVLISDWGTYREKVRCQQVWGTEWKDHFSGEEEEIDEEESDSKTQNVLSRGVVNERTKMSAKLRFRILERDNFRCRTCGASVSDGVRMHVDHIVPVAKGGLTTEKNLQCLCQECNAGKSDSMPSNELLELWGAQ